MITNKNPKLLITYAQSIANHRFILFMVVFFNFFTSNKSLISEFMWIVVVFGNKKPVEALLEKRPHCISL